MASIFWDSQGVIMIDYLEQGCTINGAYYAGKSKGLGKEITRKRRRQTDSRCSALQDNAPVHTSQVATTAATECEFELISHPPYSPNIAPSDFFLFPKLKSHLRGTQYGSNEGIIETVNEYLATRKRPSNLKEMRKLE